jgi:capping protein alpha
MSEVENIVRQFIKTSPAGDDTTIVKDIKVLLNNADADKLISSVLREHYTSELGEDAKICGDLKLVQLSNGEFSIVSSYNLSGMKFYDTKQGIQFDYDFINNKAIDIEHRLPNGITVDSSVEKMQSQLDDYVAKYYIERSYGLVIPAESESDNSDELKILIVGEKLNDANYYNGKWASVYTYNVNSGVLNAIVKIKIHYYEDGNVVLNSIEATKVGNVSDISKVIDSIIEFDSAHELSVLQKINTLNENKFKNLRRLMPISRSKIQWGRAIGNYKLGQDVVGGRG